MDRSSSASKDEDTDWKESFELLGGRGSRRSSLGCCIRGTISFSPKDTNQRRTLVLLCDKSIDTLFATSTTMCDAMTFFKTNKISSP